MEIIVDGIVTGSPDVLELLLQIDLGLVKCVSAVAKASEPALPYALILWPDREPSGLI
jgi:hypothetical protein